jgi:methionine synthase II (cobalamin-independent)
MKDSKSRILTTHAGSLPRPAELTARRVEREGKARVQLATGSPFVANRV